MTELSHSSTTRQEILYFYSCSYRRKMSYCSQLNIRYTLHKLYKIKNTGANLFKLVYRFIGKMLLHSLIQKTPEHFDDSNNVLQMICKMIHIFIHI